MTTSKKSYNEEDIEAALNDIKEKNTSIRKAAFKYGILFSTLIGRKNNNNASFKGSRSTTVSHSKQSQLWCMRLGSYVIGIMV